MGSGVLSTYTHLSLTMDINFDTTGNGTIASSSSVGGLSFPVTSTRSGLDLQFSAGNLNAIVMEQNYKKIHRTVTLKPRDGQPPPTVGNLVVKSEDGQEDPNGRTHFYYTVAKLGVWGLTDRFDGVIVSCKRKRNIYVVSYRMNDEAYVDNLWNIQDLYLGQRVGLSVGGGVMESWVDEAPEYVNGEPAIHVFEAKVLKDAVEKSYKLKVLIIDERL